ncbi:hypothetical protein K402DRAFT_415990 [Aulographum hederae CBS 113979]|uniref:Formylmethionine deformylase-like protein n=1 Tax=Aulographum hederae CBS 113979 TaxID=1176131 RepID=A0A6G1HGK9_9PEZI|nr:hypothetical protein K402DRAFT_415990 [Aulographum hederae CBS 113979]
MTNAGDRGFRSSADSLHSDGPSGDMAESYDLADTSYSARTRRLVGANPQMYSPLDGNDPQRNSMNMDYSSPPVTPYDSYDAYRSPSHPIEVSPMSKQSTFGPGRSSFSTQQTKQNLVQRRAGEVSSWGIHWWTPTCIVVLFLLGFAAAFGHHAFYQSLDGHPAREQLKMIRYGTAFAFFVKATLVGSVALSFRQRIWYSFRRKAMSVDAIDGLFAAVEDPTMFFRWEMIKGAKIATLMAAATWLIPIAAVLSPASLVTGVSTVSNDTICQNVASLDFSIEGTKNFRTPTIKNGLQGVALSYFNTTDISATTPGWFDYYDQPSKNARRTAVMSVYSKSPVEPESVTVMSCGQSWNCTYTMHFVGPGYKCSELASGVGSNTDALAAMAAPFNTSTLAPEGNNIYTSVVDLGEYLNPQVPTGNNGEPLDNTPIPADLGAFKTEPVLWIGYTINTTEPLPADSPYAAKWKTVMIPKIFSCEHWEANYTVFMNYTIGRPSATVIERNWIAPIVNTSLGHFPNGTLDPSSINPSLNYVLSDTDVPRYKLTTAYHSLGKILREFLAGYIDHEQSYPVLHTDISDTKLINIKTWFPVENLQDAVQFLYEDIILSLLSDPQFLVNTNTSVPCTRTKRANVYQYRARDLWLGYTVVLAITLAFVIVGFISMHSNGVVSDTVFSRIMATTRNPTLDQLSVGTCLGSDPFPCDLRKAKLKFGVLEEKEGSGGFMVDGVWIAGAKVAHCAFGTEDETGPIVRRRAYAGLTRQPEYG